MSNRKNRFIDGVKEFLKAEFSEDFISEVTEKAWNRYDSLILENANEPKIMWTHTRERIYPGIAVFYALLDMGVEREKSALLLKNYYKKRSEKPAAMIQKIMKIPGLYKKVPKFFARMTKKVFGEPAGFKARFYEEKKDAIKFDMLVCPYQEICKKYGCPEIVEMYCDADDVCYGNMHPKIQWLRTKTLGKGGDCCDFEVRVLK
ncbi:MULTISPECIES: L-2-amino-thiazoline-4-carboxylic acid hydrolase [unclassified Treponema]|uniref:L-2-amino-thiazoline-4-carboxylic acid hydrolase n=1 Tax=unclassified Treponema TaxID=2638727 RepID=UPI0020A57708|nr:MULTISPECIES: L-2-amino-thiazoline-4-carboxylic acid hydrolase [unclassified Treponema]UTC66806.1 L-2-amino-thiazoline-4-carboxylic acid hydrolase [Treponema sp. OMZ 789]UTC69538.1 L-2-amino-thiazoline-4-carboxylic acid hydrolase [Treponema sp. OMZ 790]UTC72251.1 L-2-amino-thiazoline-4-carboxylic acid hydrolase [Treponema sp. OMZ 791]